MVDNLKLYIIDSFPSIDELLKDADKFCIYINSKESTEYNLYDLITYRIPIEIDASIKDCFVVLVYKNNKLFASVKIQLSNMILSIQNWINMTISDNTNNKAHNTNGMTCTHKKRSSLKTHLSNTIMNTTNNLVLNLMSCFKLKLVLCDNNTTDINSTITANSSNILHKGNKQPSKKVIKSSLGKFYYNNNNKQHINNYNTYYTTSHSNNNTTHNKHHTNISTPLHNQSANNSFLEYQNPLSHSYCLDSNKHSNSNSNSNNIHTNVFKISHTRSNSNTLSNPFSLSKTNSTKNIRKAKLFTNSHNTSHIQSKSKPSFVNINVNINKESSSSPSSLPQSSRVNDLLDKEQLHLQHNSDCVNKSYKHFTDLKNDFVIFYTNEYIPSITNDLLKLECELCVDKSLELFKAYHLELNELKLRYETYKEIYVKWSKKYLNIKKKLFELQIEKEKNQINTFYKMYIIKTKSTQNKEIDIKTNKQEMHIIKGLMPDKDNQIQHNKIKLKDIIKRICTLNEHKVNTIITDTNIKEYISNTLLKKNTININNNTTNNNTNTSKRTSHHKSNSNIHHKKLKYSYSGNVNINRVNSIHTTNTSNTASSSNKVSTKPKHKLK